VKLMHNTSPASEEWLVAARTWNETAERARMALKSIRRKNKVDTHDWLNMMYNWLNKSQRAMEDATNLGGNGIDLANASNDSWWRNDRPKKPGSWWKSMPVGEHTGEEGSLVSRSCEIFDNTRLVVLNSQFQLDVAYGMPYGSRVDSQEECLSYCWRQPSCSQVVYAKYNRACYPVASASTLDKDGKAGDNRMFTSARCGVRTCSSSFENWRKAKTGLRIDPSKKKAHDFAYAYQQSQLLLLARPHSVLQEESVLSMGDGPETEGTKAANTSNLTKQARLEDPYFLSDMPNFTSDADQDQKRREEALGREEERAARVRRTGEGEMKKAVKMGAEMAKEELLKGKSNDTRIKVGSWDECMDLCKKHNSCKQAVFDKYEYRCDIRTRRVGFDENGIGGSNLHYRSTFCSARTCMLFDGWKKSETGLDYLRLNVSNSTPWGSNVTWAECLRACESNYDCQQTVFNKGTGACFPLAAALQAEASGKDAQHSGWVSAYCFDADVNPLVAA